MASADEVRREAARIRAIEALEGVTDTNARHIYLKEYSTDGCGSSSSIRATLSKEFVRRHGIENQDKVFEFFDTETGALVILPKDGDFPVDEPVGGD